MTMCTEAHLELILLGHPEMLLVLCHRHIKTERLQHRENRHASQPWLHSIKIHSRKDRTMWTCCATCAVCAEPQLLLLIVITAAVMNSKPHTKKKRRRHLTVRVWMTHRILNCLCIKQKLWQHMLDKICNVFPVYTVAAPANACIHTPMHTFKWARCCEYGCIQIKRHLSLPNLSQHKIQFLTRL